ncbi:hypothetical protein FRC03_006888 [Tulasnella sp. 419]|nr:hypothetical protein FRC03_006888 [Tulasnella sp. 419]
MRQPSLGSLWPAPSGVDWLKNGVDLLKTPDRDDIEAWCWRGLIWTWLLAKNHFSELGMLDHDGQTEGAKKEVEQAIEVGEIKWDWPAGSHPSGISNVEQYIKVEVQGEENGNNRPEKTLEQSKDEELKRAKGDGEKIKQLLFDEKSIGFVMDFILKMGMKRIMEHNHLMGRYWIPVAEDYLKTASKDPQCQQFHSISVVLELLSEYRPRPTA